MAIYFPPNQLNGTTHIPDNGIEYTYNSEDGSWTAAVGGGGSGDVYWEETGNVLSPITITRDVAVGGLTKEDSVYLEASGNVTCNNVTCNKVTSTVYGLESLPSLPV
tara:strand:+ start:10483 stop:10803 length:321 start_codon:yes stop_codon:yes gene_type:complete